MNHPSDDRIEVGIAYLVEGKFAPTPKGRALAKGFLALLKSFYPAYTGEIYTRGL